MKNYIVWILITVFCSITLAKENSIPVRGSTSKGLKSIDTEMLKIMAETDYSSATLAISYKGKLRMVRGYGRR